jgi:hypothetical protein
MPFGACLVSFCEAQSKVSQCTGDRMVKPNKQLASRMPFSACLVFFCEAQSKVSQTNLLRDTSADSSFLAHMLVHVQVFGSTGDRTIKPHGM